MHDIPYWMGGNEEDRLAADEELRSCVIDETNTVHGSLMYRGVRIGGRPGTALPWRWAYGFEGSKEYQEHSQEQAREIYNKLNGVYLEHLIFSVDMTDYQKAYIEDSFERIRMDLLNKTGL